MIPRIAKRIVIIEDDPTILRGLSDSLRGEYFEVQTASDGADGYQLVMNTRPDLILLDLTLPGMDGREICRQLRGHGVATPILMLTAQDGESDRVQGFEAGADDYVTKPFSVRELIERVRAILRRSEGRSDLQNQKELDDARAIQQRLMPSNIPQLAGFEIAATWLPARIVSGDYFDVIPIDGDTVAFCIADVSGKGMPAAMIMANLQAAVKTCASNRMSPRQLCERVNRVMCGNMSSGFITFFYAVIDLSQPAEQRLTYCNAGHNPPIVVHADGVSSRLDRGGGILGAFAAWEYEERQIEFAAGDRLLLYTDGLAENCDSAGAEFGERRLIDLTSQSTSAAALVNAVILAATQFSNGNFEDDITVLAISAK